MGAWWTSPPRIGHREALLVALGAAAVAVIQFWPLVLHLGHEIPLDLGDPLPQSWQVAWDGHALVSQPLRFFQSNQFWPLPDSLAFSDALIGYTPAGLLGSGPVAAVARYDLLFLLSFSLAFFGAWLLAREIGIPAWAAPVAGAAFAYAPWRLEQGGHLHVLSSGGIPLALALLLHGYRRGRGWIVFGGWAVVAWQLSLGFTLGLQLIYLLAVLAVVGAVLWLRAGRPSPTRGTVVSTAAGLALTALTAVVLSLPYLRVLHDHPEAARSAELVSRYSPPLRAFLAAPETSLVWGAATSWIRSGMTAVPEKTLFPGLLIVAMAIAGLFWRGLPRGLRAGLGIGVVALALLSMGFQAKGPGAWMPYRLVYEALPGWRGVRVPGRLNTLTSLLLALLAAGGTASLATALGSRRHRSLAVAAPLAVALGILVEGSGFVYPHPSVPAAPPGLSAVRPPMLQLPARPEDNRRYLLWSTDGFPEMMNGRTSFEPAFFSRTLRRVEGFPDRASVLLLRRIGVRSVVLYPAAATGTPWSGAEQRPVGPGVTRRRVGKIVVYDLGP